MKYLDEFQDPTRARALLAEIAASVTRKAFTNEAMLERLDRELSLERERIDKQLAEDRKADADRLERIETDIRAMRDLMFEAFQRGRTD